MIRAVIFTLLALSVSAANWGHSSWSGVPSYSYSSYPSSVYGSGLFGSLYGSGLHYGAGLGHGYYGSGLHYGAGLGHGYYGSGLHYGGLRTLHGGHHLTSAIKPSIYSAGYDAYNPSRVVLNKNQIISNAPGKMEFIMGDAGHKAYSGAMAGYGKAPVIKYTPRVPYSSAAMLGGGFIRNDAPANINFVLGGTGFQTGAAVLEGHNKPALHHYSAMIPHSIGSMHSSGVLANDAPGKIEFVMGDSGYKIGADAISGQTKPVVLKHAIGGPQRTVLRPAGGLAYSSVHGQPGFSPIKPAINVFPGAAVAPKLSAGNIHQANLIRKSGAYGLATGVSAGPHMSFDMGHHAAPKKLSMNVASIDKVIAPAVAISHGPALHSTGIHGIPAIAGHGSILPAHDIAGLSGLHYSGVIPAPVLTAGTAIRPSTGNIHRANLIRKSGAYGLASGVLGGSHMAFDMGHQAALRKPAMHVASLDKVITPAIATSHGSGIPAASLHSAGIGGMSTTGGHGNILFAHGAPMLHSSAVIPAAPVLTAFGPSNVYRTNVIHKSGIHHGLTSGLTGPQISFNLGETAIRKPGMNVASLEKVIAPAIATSYGNPSILI